jgi:hypothetical protein
MLGKTVSVLTVAVAFCAAPWSRAASPGQDTQKQQSKERDKDKEKAAPGKEPTASLTGCVDEQEGNYILLSDRTMTPIANLEADGFPREGFAKHVGHKVTVRGTSNSQGTTPLIKVRSIETVSDSCTPQQ